MDPQYTSKLLATVSASAADPQNAARTGAQAGPHAILQSVYSAIIDGDFGLFRDALTDDVELSIAGFAAMDGTWRGKDEVVEATRRNFAMLDSQKPEIEGMIAQGNLIAVMLREGGVIKATGQHYRIRVVQWFTFGQNKIKRIDQILASV